MIDALENEEKALAENKDELRKVERLAIESEKLASFKDESLAIVTSENELRVVKPPACNKVLFKLMPEFADDAAELIAAAAMLLELLFAVIVKSLPALICAKLLTKVVDKELKPATSLVKLPTFKVRLLPATIEPELIKLVAAASIVKSSLAKIVELADKDPLEPSKRLRVSSDK